VPDPIFERYKEALKAGHVAVLRGLLDEALAHYREAAEIAPERPLPHSSLGGVLLRLGRADEALAAYARALGRNPRDEAALSGRVEALLAAGRTTEAAEALDRLAEVQESTDRGPEALETLGRALGLGSTRRRLQRQAALRAALSGEAAAGPATPVRAARRKTAPAAPTRRRRQAGPRAAGGAPTPAAAPAPPPAPDPEGLLASAADAAAEGRVADAVESYVAAAVAHLAAGEPAAAFDACQRGLEVAPGAPALHVELARLYLARGWHERAVEKLLLLDRLLEIDGDRVGRAAAAELIRHRLADEPRLADLAAAAGD
jgi:tetratricopeptide (TPR) repeat protein